MKIFFWLLVAANVIFFAIMKFGMLEGEQAMPMPLHAEKIIVLKAAPPDISSASSQVVAPQPASATAAAKPAEKPLACFEWGEFAGPELDRAVLALDKLQLGNKLTRREGEHAIGFWVYIPPLKDKAVVAAKVAQLKARGVTEYFVVQDAGEWLNAISLGVFKTRDSAMNFLEGLRANGVHSAQVGERSGKNRAVVLVLNGLNPQLSDKVTALQKDFAGSELKIVSCH